MSGAGAGKLWRWFGLSYASWLTLPRVLMCEMPDEWQGKMAELLEEYEKRFPAADLVSGIEGTRVQCVRGGRLVKTPADLISYRHPNREFVRRCTGARV